MVATEVCQYGCVQHFSDGCGWATLKHWSDIANNAAAILAQKGYLEAARLIWNRVLEENPGNSLALYGLGRISEQELLRRNERR